MMDDRNHDEGSDATIAHPAGRKRAYRSPSLIEYGSVEDLVDAGVVGSVPSVPSITPKAS